MKAIDVPKLAKHKVDALTIGEVQVFIKEVAKLPNNSV